MKTGWWLGPIQFNLPSKGIGSMDSTDRCLAIVYGAITLGLSICSYQLGGGITIIAPVLGAIVLANRLGIWCA